MGVHISYIDADQNQAACQSFGINSVPTIIITDNTNNVVFRRSGVMSKEEFSNTLNKFK
jgi:thioredoxin-like negative regulator of GroEL